MSKKEEEMNKTQALELVRIFKEADRQYRESLSPRDIPVTSFRINWGFIEEMLEKYRPTPSKKGAKK